MHKTLVKYPFSIVSGFCFCYTACCFYLIMCKLLAPSRGIDGIAYSKLITHCLVSAIVGLCLSYAGRLMKKPTLRPREGEGEQPLQKDS
ncbi:MAG: hypothetical protein H8E44_00725 [Planctomycetes bacterium]|nr:hypothetical protein [Planctomycetota bacterium]